MLTDIDKQLYPPSCEVIKIANERYVYPIFKNASTSIYKAAKENNWEIVLNNKIKRCKSIEIILRDPLERFTKGLTKYVELTLSEHSDLDKHTVEYFAANMLFLNRHYLPQMHWLWNLSRFINDDCILELYDLSRMTTITPYYENKSVQISSVNWSNTIRDYVCMDECLLTMVGQKLTWAQILDEFEKAEPSLFRQLSRNSNALF